MVKNIRHKLAYCVFAVFCIVFLLPQGAYAAASLTASVDRTQVTVGESFTMDLKLSGTSPKADPDFSRLKNDFTIYSTGRSSQTTIINGKVSSSIDWNVMLMPKKEGKLTIPAMSLDTDAGRLNSQPVTIEALSASAAAKSQQNGAVAESRAVMVRSEISHKAPYQNQPVIMTVRMLARRSVVDISLQDPTSNDAIIERQGQPQVYDDTLDGRPVKAIKVRYLVTPLKSGHIVIPAPVFQGQAASGQKMRDPFADDFGQDMPDPFGMMKNFGNFPGMETYVPFAMPGQEIALDVKPPAAQMDPWLPATELTLADQWDGLDKAKVGEPLTRKITITAKGTSSVSLPSLEKQVEASDDFKVYEDKPVAGDDDGGDGKSLGGWRQESYTLIPQKSGTLTLPEIRLSWWNADENKAVEALIPAKTIEVAPGELTPTSDVGAKPQESENHSASAPVSAPVPQPEQNPESAGAVPVAQAASVPLYLYVALAVLSVLVLALGAALIYTMRRRPVKENSKAASSVTAANQDKTPLASLKKTKTALELKKFMQDYARDHWGMAQNASLQSISAELERRYPEADLSLMTSLDGALYAGKSLDIETTKQALFDAIKATEKSGAPHEKTHKKLGDLNPS